MPRLPWRWAGGNAPVRRSRTLSRSEVGSGEAVQETHGPSTSAGRYRCARAPWHLKRPRPPRLGSDACKHSGIHPSGSSRQATAVLPLQESLRHEHAPRGEPSLRWAGHGRASWTLQPTARQNLPGCPKCPPWSGSRALTPLPRPCRRPTRRQSRTAATGWSGQACRKYTDGRKAQVSGVQATGT